MSDYTEHARLSPSGSKKWMSCPGSLTMEAPIPVKHNEAADKGTCCHIIAARCLTEQLTPDAFLGQDVKVSSASEDLREQEFTEELCDLVREYIKHVRQYINGSRIEDRFEVGSPDQSGKADAYNTSGAVHFWVEQRVSTSWFLGVEDQFGTADVMIMDVPEKELQVHDGKFGHRRVGVERNSQLLIYAGGALDLLSLSYEIERIRIVIHQPQINNGPLEWTCTRQELEVFLKHSWDCAQLVELAGESWKRITDEADYRDWCIQFLNPHPNEEECAYCRAMATCPNAIAEVERTVGASFSAIVETKEEPRSWVPDPGAKLDELMRATGFLEDFITATRARMEGHLLGGGESAFYGLELGRQGHRRWTDPDAAEGYMRKSMRLTIEEAYNFKLKSPTQIEKMAGEYGKTNPKAQAHEGKNPRKVGKKWIPRDVKGVTLPPAVVGPMQWDKLKDMITRNPAKPSVKPLDAIKNPYKAPPLSGDSFQPVVDTVDDIS